jgi:hypothetical protein
MNNEKRWIAYDWIKLVVALSLLLVVVNFLAPSFLVKATPTASLPPYPPADFSWQLDTVHTQLLDPQGVPVYALTEDELRWQPLLSPHLLEILPQEVQMLQTSAGDWIIQGMEGKKLAEMKHATHLWQVAQVEAQVLPTATMQASQTPTSLPPTATPQAATAAPLISFLPTMTDYDCPMSLPSQLVVGELVVAQANIYMRSAPYIADNVITYHLAGTELTVLDGPECVAHGDGYYLWWLVEGPYGLIGWSAENTLTSGDYLMVPAP